MAHVFWRLPCPFNGERTGAAALKPSGREADMSDRKPVDDDAIGFGLGDDSEIQAMARRQFVASIAVAIVIALGFALALIMPASRDHADVAARRSIIVQQPAMEILPGHRIAAAKPAERELP
jgi:hypothetical protein